MKFKDFLNEMPKYINHDYLDFTPMEDRSLSFLESKWDKIKPYKDEDVLIFMNKRKTMALLGKSVYDDDKKSWMLEVATWLNLDSSYTSNGHKRVIGVHTKEDIRGKSYTSTLYLSLYYNGIKLESDNEQYQGAKPLWKRLSRIIDVEVYDDKTKKVIYPKYDERYIKDSEIWSESDEHFLKTLRMK